MRACIGLEGVNSSTPKRGFACFGNEVWLHQWIKPNLTDDLIAFVSSRVTTATWRRTNETSQKHKAKNRKNRSFREITGTYTNNIVANLWRVANG